MAMSIDEMTKGIKNFRKEVRGAGADLARIRAPSAGGGAPVPSFGVGDELRRIRTALESQIGGAATLIGPAGR